MPENEEELSVGSPIISFQLPSTTGGEVGPAQFQGKKAVALFFVREFN